MFATLPVVITSTKNHFFHSLWGCLNCPLTCSLNRWHALAFDISAFDKLIKQTTTLIQCQQKKTICFYFAVWCSGAIVIGGSLKVITSSFRTGIEFSGDTESRIDFRTDVDFYDGVKMCLQMGRPAFTFRYPFLLLRFHD